MTVIYLKDRKEAPQDQILEALDEKYLGRKFPGNPRERQVLLQALDRLLKRHGEEWVRNHKRTLLEQAERIVQTQVL